MSEEKESRESSVNLPSQAPKKRRWKLVLLGLIILFCGMVIGAGITFHMGSVMIFRAMGPGDGMAERIAKRIDRDLGLTEAQRTQVAEIVARRVSAFKRLLTEIYPRIKGQVTLLHDEIAPILTEEQKLKWAKHCKRMQEVITQIHEGRKGGNH
jgi:hypothetical protein